MKKIIALLAIIFGVICLGGCVSESSEGTDDCCQKAIIKMPDGSIETIDVWHATAHEGYLNIYGTNGKKYSVSYENCIVVRG